MRFLIHLIDEAPEIENDVSVPEIVPAIEDDLTFAPTLSTLAAPLAKEQIFTTEDVPFSDLVHKKAVKKDKEKNNNLYYLHLL